MVNVFYELGCRVDQRDRYSRESHPSSLTMAAASFTRSGPHESISAVYVHSIPGTINDISIGEIHCGEGTSLNLHTHPFGWFGAATENGCRENLGASAGSRQQHQLPRHHSDPP